MKVPLKITYRNMDSSPSLERSIREQVSKLERLHDGIIGCRVTVESPHHSHTKGNHYRIRVEVTVPGREIVADRGPDKHDEHEDPFVAVRDAFRAAQRGLLGYLTRRRELRRAN